MAKVDSAANSLREKISLMVDGELDGDQCAELIEHLAREGGEGTTCWDHYHLIGDAMRDELPDMLYTNLSGTISSAIATEPAHQLTSTSNVTHITPVAAVQNRSPLFGYAIAASISAFAIAGLYQLNQERYQPQPTVQVVANQPQPELSTISWSREVSSDKFPVNSHYSRATIPTEKLHQYLINHNEHAVGTPAQGTMLPYARLVGYERPQ